MSGFIWNDDIRRLLEALEPLASKVETRTLHWIQTPEGTLFSADGFCWCHDCAYFKVRNLRRRNRVKARRYRNDFFVDGGWGGSEDGNKFCCGCGVRLRHTLTTYACDEELAHFSEHPPRPGCPNDAYEIVQILEALECTSETDADARRMVGEIIGIANALVEQSLEPRP